MVLVADAGDDAGVADVSGSDAWSGVGSVVGPGSGAGGGESAPPPPWSFASSSFTFARASSRSRSTFARAAVAASRSFSLHCGRFVEGVGEEVVATSQKWSLKLNLPLPLSQFQAIERSFFIAVSRKLSEVPDFPEPPSTCCHELL